MVPFPILTRSVAVVLSVDMTHSIIVAPSKLLIRSGCLGSFFCFDSLLNFGSLHGSGSFLTFGSLKMGDSFETNGGTLSH